MDGMLGHTGAITVDTHRHNGGTSRPFASGILLRVEAKNALRNNVSKIIMGGDLLIQMGSDTKTSVYLEKNFDLIVHQNFKYMVKSILG